MKLLHLQRAARLGWPACLALAFLAGCGDTGANQALVETVRTQQELERRLRSDVTELERKNRELRLQLTQLLEQGRGETAPSPQASELELEVRTLSERVRSLEYELVVARSQTPAVSDAPDEVARRFLTSVVRSDARNIEALVDWRAMVEETRRRDPEASGPVSAERLARLVQETRQRFLDLFTGDGPGRQIVMSLVGRSDRGTVPSRTVRLDLGENLAEAGARWSILLRKMEGRWRVVGVLQESIEPASSGGEVPENGNGGG